MRRWSVPVSAAIVALTLAAVVWWNLAPPATLVKAGQMAPDFSLPHWNAPSVRASLQSFRGSPVLLAFFDSSWPSSGMALAEMEKAHRRFLQRGLVVVGVALDPPQEAKAVEFLIANRGLSFVILMDPDGAQTAPLYGVPSRRMPVTYVVDSTGRVVTVHLTPQPWVRQDLLDGLAALLPPRPPPGIDSPRPPG